MSSPRTTPCGSSRATSPRAGSPATTSGRPPREIVTLLQGFTLAVEVVAVHLAERGGQLTCAALRDRLKAEGLTGLENIAGLTTRGIPHVERLLTVTLAPTLAALSAPESFVLVLAALLPADHVPLPWLRAVAAERFPTSARTPRPATTTPGSQLSTT